MTTLAHVGAAATTSTSAKPERPMLAVAVLIALILGPISAVAYSQLGTGRFAPTFATELTQEFEMRS
jgi:hypothetical protein